MAKTLKAEDLRSWSEAELSARISELEEERFRLTFRTATEALEGDAALRRRDVRKDIARLHTVLNEKKRGVKERGARSKASMGGKAK